MKVLLTGANGFVAAYLAKELVQSGHQIVLTGRESVASLDLPYFKADLSDQKQAFNAIQWSQPDAVVHLAGIAHVTPQQDAQRAKLITSVNVDATSYLCEALHNQSRDSILLFISSGLVYQPTDPSGFTGYTESSALGPVNDYGWSKLAAEAIVRIYDSAHLKTYVARPFNHTGPGQDFRFVAPTLAKRIIEAKDGGAIPVGNLDAMRDFSDVRDIVRAYRLILEQKPSHRTFVLGSGKPIPISSILEFFVKYSGKNISVERDSDLIRTEHDLVFGNPQLAKNILHWQPEVPFEKTLQDLYDHLQQSLKSL